MDAALAAQVAASLRDESHVAVVLSDTITVEVRAVSRVEILAAGLNPPVMSLKQAKDGALTGGWGDLAMGVIRLGLVSPRIWDGDPAACPIADGYVTLPMLAKYHERIFNAICEASGLDVQLVRAAEFRGARGTGGSTGTVREGGGNDVDAKPDAAVHASGD